MSFEIVVQNNFSIGFEEDYRTVKGDTLIVPIGSTDFRVGIKVGIKAAGE